MPLKVLAVSIDKSLHGTLKQARSLLQEMGFKRSSYSQTDDEWIFPQVRREEIKPKTKATIQEGVMVHLGD